MWGGGGGGGGGGHDPSPPLDPHMKEMSYLATILGLLTQHYLLLVFCNKEVNVVHTWHSQSHYHIQPFSKIEIHYSTLSLVGLCNKEVNFVHTWHSQSHYF